ncbi:putative diacylglycerol O-acyltransferase [Austwickia sp. TVS 96-490-7B]|uniref:wax ester/triacylglycerol synthase domain-containing protein n=1 Tax=Austwickia sp. TVS 96-490-7B TaxID=2830843 RepID=UPI001D897902|nr:wax ester/triacylglycerol synthase domain-containing protein [Austwickia sp. TVS 96-490-7B]MBW3085300.1 putative diacylglycerol O-acyltransferase [Austwickia sp. TVS 96-490-7B]
MEFMTSTERIFLRLERPGFPIDVVGVAVLAPPFEAEPGAAQPCAAPQGGDGQRDTDQSHRPDTFEVVRRTLARTVAQTPYLRRRVSPAPLGIGEDRWVSVAEVDLDEHVRRVSCPAPGDTRALLDLMLDLTAHPLDRRRPLWEAWYVEGLQDHRDALILRGHHALTDGLGFMQLHQAIFSDAPTSPDVAMEPATSHRQPDASMPEVEPGLLFRALAEVPERLLISTIVGSRVARAVVREAPEAAGRLVRGAARVMAGAAQERSLDALPRLPRLPRFIPSWTSHPPVTRFNRHVSDPRKSMAVATFPMAQVQAARCAHPGATVNDVVLALVAGALRTELARHGELPDEPLVTTCPVNVRAKPGRESSGVEGNTFTAIWVEVPVHLPDPGDRLAAVHAGSTRAKGQLGRSRASWDLLSDVGDLFVPGVVSAAMEFAGSRAFQVFPPTQNLSVSTMPGPRTPLYLGERKVENLYARTVICPPIHLFIHAITYADAVEMGVLSVAEILPDPEVVTAGLRRELDALVALSAVPPEPSRVTSV